MEGETPYEPPRAAPTPADEPAASPEEPERHALCRLCGDHLVFVTALPSTTFTCPANDRASVEHLDPERDLQHRPDLMWIRGEVCCDFCGSAAVTWSYQVLPGPTATRMMLFNTEENRILDPFATANDTPWSACQPCADLIEAGHWAGLVEQHLARARLIGTTIGPHYLVSVGECHRQFAEQRTGAREPYEPNTPRP